MGQAASKLFCLKWILIVCTRPESALAILFKSWMPQFSAKLQGWALWVKDKATQKSAQSTMNDFIFVRKFLLNIPNHFTKTAKKSEYRMYTVNQWDGSVSEEESNDWEFEYSCNTPTTEWGSSGILCGYEGTPLTMSIVKGENEKLKKLLKLNALEPNKGVMYPTIGMSSSSLPLLKDFTGEDEPVYPLWLAVYSGNTKAVRLLLRHKDIDTSLESWNCGSGAKGYYSTPKELAWCLTRVDLAHLFTLQQHWHKVRELLVATEDCGSTLQPLFFTEPHLALLVAYMFVSSITFEEENKYASS